MFAHGPDGAQVLVPSSCEQLKGLLVSAAIKISPNMVDASRSGVSKICTRKRLSRLSKSMSRNTIMTINMRERDESESGNKGFDVMNHKANRALI